MLLMAVKKEINKYLYFKQDKQDNLDRIESLNDSY